MHDNPVVRTNALRFSFPLPLAVSGALVVSPAARAQTATPAGTVITNVARLNVAAPDGSTAPPIVSNSVSLTLAQLVDVAVTAALASQPVVPDAAVAVAFDVTNTGNADDDFALSVAVDAARATYIGISADGADGAALAPPAVRLRAGERRRVHVLLGPVAAGDPLPVRLGAVAQSASGTPGAVRPGAGPNGADLVVGSGGARADAVTLLGTDAAAGTDAATLAKSQSVRAPDGSTRAVPGAVVTYRLVARFTAPALAALVEDAVPPGTRYVAGSLSVDARAVSDADDDDACRFDGTAIHVALGDVPAAATRTIRFQVTIQ